MSRRNISIEMEQNNDNFFLKNYDLNEIDINEHKLIKFIYIYVQ